MAQKYGYEMARWEQVKAEMKAILGERAKRQRPILYSELVDTAQVIRFEPNSHALAAMLGEISAEEDAAGRGMLTVLVVHKDGDYQPGPGFFELAQELGRGTSDIDKCWVEESRKVYRAWGARI